MYTVIASCTTTFSIRERCAARTGSRPMCLAGIKAQIGYKRRPGRYGGRSAVAINNTLGRQFNVKAPDKVWVTDITYIRTCESLGVMLPQRFR
ncbi:hypothetical protein JNB75_19345 [Rhizobium pusense]|nr:hypothetical protein [Agrobacterium pusense]MBW9085119.1 hypothetical protein [Agrobacterium pusense]MBW9125406.1 hypothetical protein [Agrobacterium pusense]MBW9137821.1 hypothetical protein [Agrobacterium pusense]